jgi:hypothetical protein
MTPQTCGACEHYRRHALHPRLGICAAGKQAPGACSLWWDNDVHDCERHEPLDDLHQ